MSDARTQYTLFGDRDEVVVALDRNVRGSVAALRAHLTRQRHAHAAAIKVHEKAFALAAIGSLQARIDALIDSDTQQTTRIAFDLFGPYELLLPLSRCECVRRATPRWLTPKHRGQVQEKYREARQRSRDEGVDFHVDHIVPIQGARVSGLHVPWNLAVIPAAENMAKKNRFSQITGLGSDNARARS